MIAPPRGRTARILEAVDNFITAFTALEVAYKDAPLARLTAELIEATISDHQPAIGTDRRMAAAGLGKAGHFAHLAAVLNVKQQVAHLEDMPRVRMPGWVAPLLPHEDQLLLGQVVNQGAVALARLFAAEVIAAGACGELEEHPPPIRADNRKEHRHRLLAKPLLDPGAVLGVNLIDG